MTTIKCPCCKEISTYAKPDYQPPDFEDWDGDDVTRGYELICSNCDRAFRYVVTYRWISDYVYPVEGPSESRNRKQRKPAPRRKSR